MNNQKMTAAQRAEAAKDQIIEAYRAGHGLVRIAKQVRTTKENIREHLVIWLGEEFYLISSFPRREVSIKLDAGKQDILKRFNGGESLRSIAKSYGVSHGTVSAKVKKWSESADLKTPSAERLELVKDQVIAGLFDEGMKLADMARLHKCSEHILSNKVKQWLGSNVFKENRRSKFIENDLKRAAEHRDQVAEMYRQNVSQVDMCKATGLPKKMISEMVKQMFGENAWSSRIKAARQEGLKKYLEEQRANQVENETGFVPLEEKINYRMAWSAPSTGHSIQVGNLYRAA